MEIDLARILFAFIGGYLLSLAGSLSQITTNNPIASPSTLGMDGVGVLCVLVTHSLLLIFDEYLSPEVMSFLIFILAFVLFYFAAPIFMNKKKVRVHRDANKGLKKIILLGLTFNLFVGALFSVFQFLFMALNLDFPSALWFGSFKYVDMIWLWLFIPTLFYCFYAVWSLATDLEKLNLGDSFARGMGIDIIKVQRRSMILSLFTTVLVISFFGVFSFLGLILPHILRSFNFFSRSLKRELLIGPIISGVGLFLIDSLCFSFTYQGAELPVGMVSGVLGSFFLIFLIGRSKI